MLFTGCEVRMRKTVPEVLKTAQARRARDVFKTEGTEKRYTEKRYTEIYGRTIFLY
jgi:hypothetical protein